MNQGTGGAADTYLRHMTKLRDGAATLKIRLINLREKSPHNPIFAFEGDDDKVVYAQWTRRVQPNLQYEALPCKGKSGVLALLGVTRRDLSGIGKNVFFFFDKDFDGLRGEEGGDGVFITDAYSIENYLVDEVVLEDILKNELHCHEELETRAEVKRIFNSVYDEFLSITRDLNFRIFVARRTSDIDITQSLSNKISAIAAVSFSSVVRSEKSLEDLAPYSREPSAEEVAACKDPFEMLAPKRDFRGKFALLFFQRWLLELTSEFGKRTGPFAKMNTTSRPRIAELVVSNFASKSNLPEGFADFLANVAKQQRC